MGIRFSAVMLLMVILVSCQEKKSTEEKVSQLPRIINKEVLISFDNCSTDSISCTYVRIEYPYFSDSTETYLNDLISQKLTEAATQFFREEAINNSFEYMANMFIDDYISFHVDFPDYRIGWYVNILSEITYESDDVLSFHVDSESYTGGAHPNSGSSFFVFDKKSKKELAMADLISDTIQFKILLEREFRKQKDIGEGLKLADGGFYLDDGDFLLNNNIGLTDNSVIVHFNPYEIAPYSLGSTTLELDKKELGQLLLMK